MYKMNEIFNNFVFAGDNFMSEMHLTQLGFTYSACGYTKNKETNKNLTKQVIHDKFIKTTQPNFVFNMAWLMRSLLEEQLLIKYCVLKHLILLIMQNMMDGNRDLLQWFINFLMKKPSGGTIKNENISNKELAKELQNP